MAVSVSPNDQVISVGDSLRFHATPLGRGITGVVWTIEVPSVATVDAVGLVRALVPGSTGVLACAKERPAVCGVARLQIQ